MRVRRTIEFTPFGTLHGHILNIINNQYKHEATESDRYIETEVELDLMINEITCNLSHVFQFFNGEDIKSYYEKTLLYILLEIKFTRSNNSDLILLQESSLD